MRLHLQAKMNEAETSTFALASAPGFGLVSAAFPVATFVSMTFASVPGGTYYAYATDAG